MCGQLFTELFIIALLFSMETNIFQYYNFTKFCCFYYGSRFLSNTILCKMNFS
ncbi:hypothetical protein WH5701_16580, partial [Synechococcus sp. WH 5701]